MGGWDLLALRLLAADVNNPIRIPDPAVPLFASGAEAAEHGLSAIEAPPEETVAAQERLRRKYERLNR